MGQANTLRRWRDRPSFLLVLVAVFGLNVALPLLRRQPDFTGATIWLAIGLLTAAGWYWRAQFDGVARRSPISYVAITLLFVAIPAAIFAIGQPQLMRQNWYYWLALAVACTAWAWFRATKLSRKNNTTG